jgi:hypothetical protein
MRDLSVDQVYAAVAAHLQESPAAVDAENRPRLVS